MYRSTSVGNVYELVKKCLYIFVYILLFVCDFIVVLLSVR